MIFRSPEEFRQEVIRRLNEGASMRAIAREFEVSRNTVRQIHRAHQRQRDSGHDILGAKQVRESKLDNFKEQIEALTKDPDIKGQRIFEILKDQGYTGGITILRELLKKHHRANREPVIRFETVPGKQGQMDWSPYKIHFTREGKTEVQCFSYILGYSRRQFIEFTPRRDFYTLVRRHQDAFAHFGGVPLECLYDNEKTVVLRWEGGRPVFNPAFTAFITHYNCRPIACRPGRPQTKGKVERPFQYIEGNLLNGRKFQDLADLQATAKWWLREKSDLHCHNTTKRSPLELFLEAEQSALQPLPAFPYDTAEVRLVVCRADGLAQFEANWYSVPTGYIGDILSLKATEKEILLYSPDLKILARHERQTAGLGKKIEDPSHHRVKRERYGLEPVREAFLALGECAFEFLQGLEKKYPRNCGFQARFILDLKNRYETGDIHGALVHALKYQAFEGAAIARILAASAQERTLESVRNERAREILEKNLPRITSRPLAEYAALFNGKESQHEPDCPKDQDPSRNPASTRNSERPGSGVDRGGEKPDPGDGNP